MYIPKNDEEWIKYPDKIPYAGRIYTTIICANLKYPDGQMLDVRFMKELFWDNEYNQWRIKKVIGYGYENISDYIEEMTSISKEIPYTVEGYSVEQYCRPDDSQEYKSLKYMEACIRNAIEEMGIKDND